MWPSCRPREPWGERRGAPRFRPVRMPRSSSGRRADQPITQSVPEPVFKFSRAVDRRPRRLSSLTGSPRLAVKSAWVPVPRLLALRFPRRPREVGRQRDTHGSSPFPTVDVCRRRVKTPGANILSMRGAATTPPRKYDPCRAPRKRHRRRIFGRSPGGFNRSGSTTSGGLARAGYLNKPWLIWAQYLAHRLGEVSTARGWSI